MIFFNFALFSVIETLEFSIRNFGVCFCFVLEDPGLIKSQYSFHSRGSE